MPYSTPMTNELSTLTQTLPVSFTIDFEGLISAFFLGRNALTVRAYDRDLRAFRDFVGAATLPEAAARFFGADESQANAVLISYKKQLIEQKLSASSINRRLAALNSLIMLARKVKLCRYELEIKREAVEVLKDTRGPGREGFMKMLAQWEGKTDKRSLRNRALLRLLFDLGLRSNEALSLDLEHLNLEQGWAKVLGKKRSSRQLMTLPPLTQEALRGWLKVRGDEPGALFWALDGPNYGRRLGGRGLHWICKSTGKMAGIPDTRPHGLRHAAITEALDATGGDVRAVRHFSRHKSLDMLLIYDDNRKDMGGEIARLISGRT